MEERIEVLEKQNENLLQMVELLNQRIDLANKKIDAVKDLALANAEMIKRMQRNLILLYDTFHKD